MASFHQLQQLVAASEARSREFMTQMQQQQQDQLVAILKAFSQHMKDRDVAKDSATGGLNERRFRDLGTFDGKDEEWKEWALKFRAIVKELDPNVYEALKWAEEQTDEIDEEDIKTSCGENDGDGARYSTAVYNRLIHHLKGPPLMIHQSIVRESGLETWRVLAKRYNPMTPMRGLQLMLKTMLPGKIKRGEGVQAKINQWEGLVNALQRDYKETVSVGHVENSILVHMMPEDLQDHVLQHADRLREYKLVKEKVVSLTDARMRLKDPNAMDVGYAGKEYYDDEDG